MTTIEDWRPLLEERAASQHRRITIPLELRLILLTTTVVLILVAAGAHLTSVIRGAQTLATTAPLHMAAVGSWQPDGACYTPPTDGRMISARELASSYVPGIREVAPGVYHPCQLYGLVYPQPAAGAPTQSGQVILVSLSQQWLWAYQDQKLFLASPVTTGMPQLPTPRGAYNVQSKETNVTFYSLWPPGSPFYYSPEHINYAMFFRDIGYYIHDAPWRHAFGPGTQNPHTNPDGTWETGSHGCVNMPTPAAAALYAWAQVGAHVIIVA